MADSIQTEPDLGGAELPELFAGHGLYRDGAAQFEGRAASTGGCSLSVMMTGVDSIQPMEVQILARRLCFDERARIEALNEAGLCASEVAELSDRHPTTVQREPACSRGACGCVASAAQRAARRGREHPRRPSSPRTRSWPRRGGTAGSAVVA